MSDERAKRDCREIVWALVGLPTIAAGRVASIETAPTVGLRRFWR